MNFVIMILLHSFFLSRTTTNGFSLLHPKKASSARSALALVSRSMGNTATDSMRTEAVEETQKLKHYYYESTTSSFDKSLATPPTFWQSQDAAAYVDENIDTVLFDCDGVLYRTFDYCPGGPECIQGLLDKGKKVLFVTNNGGINRRELKEKLMKLLGVDSLTNEQMVSSSYSCATYLKQNLSQGSRVHVIGSAGLCEELASSGFVISGGPSDESPSMNRKELEEYDFPEHPIDAVALGHDTEFNFRKLCIANNLLLRNPNALFVTTNEDSFDLVGPDIRHIPGNGCTVKALEYCSRRKATNVGKPSKTLAELIEKEHGLDPSRSLFVGDRLDTDIRFGNENGMTSVLVMTGVTTAQTMMDLGCGTEEEPLPHFIVPYVGTLVGL